MAKNEGSIEYTDFYYVMKELRELDNDYYKEFRRNAKEVAKDLQKSIQTGIRKAGTRANPPLSGMKQVHFGRVAWGSSYSDGSIKAKPADSAIIQVPPARKSNKQGRRAIVRVVVGSPGTVMADMAGASNKFTQRYAVTRPYEYMYTIGGQKVPGIRQHRITTQGVEMIDNLSARASRYVWKAADKALPETRKNLDKLITDVNKKLNRKFRRNVAR
jgi:hypothetical protein